MQINFGKLEELVQEKLGEERNLHLAIAEALKAYAVFEAPNYDFSDAYLNGIEGFANDLVQASRYSKTPTAVEALKESVGDLETVIELFLLSLESIKNVRPDLAELVNPYLENAKNTQDIHEIIGIGLNLYNRIKEMARQATDSNESAKLRAMQQASVYPILPAVSPILNHEDYPRYLALGYSITSDPSGNEVVSLICKHHAGMEEPPYLGLEKEDLGEYLQGVNNGAQAFTTIMKQHTSE